MLGYLKKRGWEQKLFYRAQLSEARICSTNVENVPQILIIGFVRKLEKPVYLLPVNCNQVIDVGILAKK